MFDNRFIFFFGWLTGGARRGAEMEENRKCSLESINFIDKSYCWPMATDVKSGKSAGDRAEIARHLHIG
jgi:hypothetical protein